MKSKLVVFLDIISYIYLACPVLFTWSVAYFLITSSCFHFSLIIFLPFTMIVTFSLVICLLRLFLPPLKKGVYEIGFNKNYISWYLNLSLARALNSSGMKTFTLSMSWSKYLIFRALGATVPYNFQMALSCEVTDFPLIKIGKNSLLGDNSKLCAHYFNKGKLILNSIEVAEGTLITPHSFVKPGTKTKVNEIYNNRG